MPDGRFTDAGFSAVLNNRYVAVFRKRSGVGDGGRSLRIRGWRERLVFGELRGDALSRRTHPFRNGHRQWNFRGTAIRAGNQFAGAVNSPAEGDPPRWRKDRKGPVDRPGRDGLQQAITDRPAEWWPARDE